MKPKKVLKKVGCILLATVMLLPNSISNVNAEEKKEENKLIGSIDIKSIKNYVEKDGWSYDPKTKTLTLAGVNMNAYEYNCMYYYTEDPSHEGVQTYDLFDLYPGSTIIVKEGTVNNLYARISGGTFDIRNSESAGTEGVTIKGGGTLNLQGNEVAISSTVDLNIENVNINMSDGDFFAMMYADSAKRDLSFTINRSNLNIENCTGAISVWGSELRYENDDIRAVKGYKNYVKIKDSNVKMNIELDRDGERNHSCFIIRNGILDIDNSTLNLNSYHEVANVWRIYHDGEKEENLIRLNNVKLGDDIAISSDKIAGNGGFIKGETFVKKGDNLKLSFGGRSGFDMAFGHNFANGLKSVSMTMTKPIVDEDDKKNDDKKKDDKDLTYINNLSKLIVNTNTDKGDVSGSKYAKLRLKAKSGKKKISLSWKKIKGADGYVIFGSKCGTNMQKITKVTSNKYVAKKLKKGKYYKYMVVAVKGQKVLTISKSAHCVTKGGKYGNPKKLTIKKSKLTIKKGKSKKIKAKLKVSKKTKWHIAKFRYETTNAKVAKVNKKGKIKAVGKGKCSIYVYSQNGISKRIKVTVK